MFFFQILRQFTHRLQHLLAVLHNSRLNFSTLLLKSSAVLLNWFSTSCIVYPTLLANCCVLSFVCWIALSMRVSITVSLSFPLTCFPLTCLSLLSVLNAPVCLYYSFILGRKVNLNSALHLSVFVLKLRVSSPVVRYLPVLARLSTYVYVLSTRLHFPVNTRWFKYDRAYLCVNKSQFVPVIFEPPCITLSTNLQLLVCSAVLPRVGPTSAVPWRRVGYSLRCSLSWFPPPPLRLLGFRVPRCMRRIFKMIFLLRFGCAGSKSNTGQCYPRLIQKSYRTLPGPGTVDNHTLKLLLKDFLLLQE
jgi:hypothetical protein